MERTLISFYSLSLIEERYERSEDITRFTQHVPHLVTIEKNEVLLRPITRDEDKIVFNSMPSNKMSGPHKFTSKTWIHIKNFQSLILNKLLKIIYNYIFHMIKNK